MKGLIQRVSHARVDIGGKCVGAIERGVLLLLGVEKNDSEADADKLLNKVLAYRIFPDDEGKMNLSVSDIHGGVLVVSQFTLVADTSRGLRPGFSGAAAPAEAKQLYQYFVYSLRARHRSTASGDFGADMQISLVNDGPVTFMLSS